MSVFKKARENGWKPNTTATSALEANQQEFALLSLGGKLGGVNINSLNKLNSDGTASALSFVSRQDLSLHIRRAIAKNHPQSDAKKVMEQFFIDPKTKMFEGVEFNPIATTANTLNLWIGMTAKPNQGNWERIKYFLAEVVCGDRKPEYEYLIKYLAHAVQHPDEKAGVMITMLGGQGIGKGTFARILQKIWSATFLQVSRIKQVVGDFNGSLERAYIVFLDEALFAGDRASSDALKSLVTEPIISINEKHQPSRQIRSYHRFIAATNAEWFKSTDRDDRRDFVLRVNERHKGDHKFWGELNAEIENGGVDALVYELLTMDLTNFNVRNKPNTQELTAQKLQSLDKFPRWWFGLLSRGYICEREVIWPEFISTHSLLAEYKAHETNARSYKIPDERDISGYMQKICPASEKIRTVENRFRRYGFKLPTLDIARSDFETYIGDSVTWDEVA